MRRLGIAMLVVAAGLAVEPPEDAPPTPEPTPTTTPEPTPEPPPPQTSLTPAAHSLGHGGHAV